MGFGVSGTSQSLKGLHRSGLLASEYTASHNARILLNRCEEVLGCCRIRPEALPRSIRRIGIDRNLQNPGLLGCAVCGRSDAELLERSSHLLSASKYSAGNGRSPFTEIAIRGSFLGEGHLRDYKEVINSPRMSIFTRLITSLQPELEFPESI